LQNNVASDARQQRGTQEIETTFGQNFELVSSLLMTYSYVILLCYWIDHHT
jgi:hypothetical protein